MATYLFGHDGGSHIPVWRDIIPKGLRWGVSLFSNITGPFPVGDALVNNILAPAGNLFAKLNESVQHWSTRNHAWGPSSLGGYQTLQALSILFILVAVGTIITRLWLHPLSKIPGPRIAAVTSGYDFYYNVICGGTYIHQFLRWHQEYDSRVIRISPNLVHIDDPYLYDEIYNTKSDYVKADYFYKNFGIPESLVGITDPQLHHVYRNTVRPIFSTKTVNITAPCVAIKVRKAADLIASQAKEGMSVNVEQLYRRITGDIVSKLLFGNSLNLVECGKDNPAILTSLDQFLSQIWLFVHFPFLARIALRLPLAIASKLVPGYVQFNHQCEQWVKEAINRKTAGKLIVEEGQTTIFDLLLQPNPDKGYRVKTLHELVDEAFQFIIAGTDTTSHSLACATQYVLSTPGALARLRSELDEGSPFIKDELCWDKVQRLPYLTAVIKESLRMSSVIPGVLPRIVPPKGMSVDSKFLPGGTIVSISQRAVHYNASIFPEPEKFIPERWLGDQGKSLEKFNVAFSKGPRRCIGSNLAYLQMYYCLAVFFSRFDMTLVETGPESMEWVDRLAATNKIQIKVNVLSDRWNNTEFVFP